jgi:hypothetical protein
MKVYKPFAAVAGAGVLVAAVAVLPSAVGAPRHHPAPRVASAKSHVLKFTAVMQKQTRLGKTGFAEDEKDVKNGKVIGFDVINATFISSSTAKGGVTLSTKGGFLYGTLKFTNNPVTTGKVTGGTGKFKGATGTITGKDLNKKGTRTAVTITYS